MREDPWEVLAWRDWLSELEIRQPFKQAHREIRTYKIHLGSGNILMNPNDQYLCIVLTSAHTTGDLGNRLFRPSKATAPWQYSSAMLFSWQKSEK
jgi:hypothetical protein